MCSYKVLGIMSGTSLDGVDLAYCEFVKSEKWNYKILHAVTLPYASFWLDRLKKSIYQNGEVLTQWDREYGKYLGELVKLFLEKHQMKPDYISSHGHTVFHQPNKGFTLQIGHGAYIYAETGIPVVYDFRSQDVAFGGQGAPLVPIGDELLFSEYDACLNLGGFANISFRNQHQRIAYDICPVNTVLNYLSNRNGKDFDENGRWASQGKLNLNLLNQLNNLNYYQKLPPKSLGIEFVNEYILPLLSSDQEVNDLLHTCVIHMAGLIADTFNKNQIQSVLVTGGGAYNAYLIEQIQIQTNAKIIIPDDKLIQYKEATVFAFLGILRVRNEVNVLSTVTGARFDHCSGIIAGM